MSADEYAVTYEERYVHGGVSYGTYHLTLRDVSGHIFERVCVRCGLSQDDYWHDRDMYRGGTAGRCAGVDPA